MASSSWSSRPPACALLLAFLVVCQIVINTIQFVSPSGGNCCCVTTWYLATRTQCAYILLVGSRATDLPLAVCCSVRCFQSGLPLATSLFCALLFNQVRLWPPDAMSGKSVISMHAHAPSMSHVIPWHSVIHSGCLSKSIVCRQEYVLCCVN